MNMIKAIRLARKHAECPKCGNTFIGSGEGEVIITDNEFYRSCKCGWEITIKEGDNE